MFTCSLCKFKRESVYPAREYQVCKICDQAWISSESICYECIVIHREQHLLKEHGSVELVE